MSTNNLPAQVAENNNVSIGFNDSQSFDLIQRVAKCFALSTIVPKSYQNNQPNCIIALNMAARMGADPMMVMQNLYPVHGTPSWSAQFLIATFNKCGRFSSIRYDFSGTEGQDDWGCRAKATEISTGDSLTGPLITVGLAKKEGWFQKSGSKWQTMPEQMLRYRAASWFIRTIAPEIAMGLQTAEEMRDTYELENDGHAFTLPPKGQVAEDLNTILVPVVAEDAQAATTPAQTTQPEQAAPEPPFIQEQPAQGLPVPENGNSKKRPTIQELEEMRADMVAELEAKGVSLKEIEKEVGEFSNSWSPKLIEKIRGEILPGLLGE